MKNIFMAITMLLAYNANACSICGCGGGNLYLGMYPSFDSKFIGLRYNYSDYKTILKNDPSQYSINTYQSYEIWTGFNLTKKWQLFAFIPYQINKQVSDDGISNNNGVGDITLLSSFQLVNTHKVLNDKKLITHQTWIGGGVKLNTGNFKIDPRDPEVTLADVNAQMGTGSTDFIINVRDIYTLENWGLTSNINYKINSQNNKGYQFGNKLTLNTLAFYNFNHKNTVITPNIGLQFENNDGNKLNGQLISLNEGIDNGTYHTGGHILNLLGGIELNVKKVSFGVNIQTPINQEYAASQTNLHWKGMAHFTLNF
jgi:hypothetical protein